MYNMHIIIRKGAPGVYVYTFPDMYTIQQIINNKQSNSKHITHVMYMCGMRVVTRRRGCTIPMVCIVYNNTRQ